MQGRPTSWFVVCCAHSELLRLLCLLAAIGRCIRLKCYPVLSAQALLRPDPAGRQTAAIDPLCQTSLPPILPKVENLREDHPRQTAVIDPLGQPSSRRFKTFGRIADNARSTRCDNAGNIIAEIDALGDATYFDFDALGRQVSSKDTDSSPVCPTWAPARRSI